MQWIVSLTPECGPDPLKILSAPPEGASIVEIRLDLFEGLDPAAAVARCPLPCLLTLRSTAEGGLGSDDPVFRERLLRLAREAGPALLDLEWRRDTPLISRLGLTPEEIVLSFHDPTKVPEDLPQIAAKLFEETSGLVKIVTTPGRLADLESILGLFRRCSRRDRGRLINFGMGHIGLPSRYLSPLLGARAGFAAFTADTAAAPGQKDCTEMDAVCGHLAGPPSRIFGVIGRDVSSSLSPRMHSAAYRALGLPFLFLPISVSDPDDLEELFQPEGKTMFDRIGLPVGGWAVTRPYKGIAAERADIRAPRAQRARAANTLILKPGNIIADNTDADGVTASLRAAGFDPGGKRVLIRGTGGAGRGAAVGLDLAGAEVFLRSRDSTRAAETAAFLRLSVSPPPTEGISYPLLVNATPLGLDIEDPPVFSDDEIATAEIVLDMVYGRKETILAERARELGTTYIDGRSMLAYQGMAQFAAFTDRLPPREKMAAAVRCRR